MASPPLYWVSLAPSAYALRLVVQRLHLNRCHFWKNQMLQVACLVSGIETLSTDELNFRYTAT